MSSATRRQCIWKLADLFVDPVHAEMMSQLESHSFGRPFKLHMDIDISAAAEGLRCKLPIRAINSEKSVLMLPTTDYAGWCDKVTGETHLKDNGFIKAVRREPIGVVGALIAWNGPVRTRPLALVTV